MTPLTLWSFLLILAEMTCHCIHHKCFAPTAATLNGKRSTTLSLFIVVGLSDGEEFLSGLFKFPMIHWIHFAFHAELLELIVEIYIMGEFWDGIRTW